MQLLNSLVTRSVLGGVILLASIFAMSIAHNLSRDVQTSTSLWQSKLEVVTDDIGTLGQLALTYKDNAPRDFASYERDLAVFYQQFQQHVAMLDNDYRALTSTANTLTTNPLFQWFNQSETPTATALATQQAVIQSWHLIRQDLDEALGDPAQPRLEWGAEQIINREEALFSDAANLANQVATAGQWVDQRSQDFNQTMLILVAAYVLISFTTFLMFVIRPVVRTARACKQVADGQYGLNVDLNGSGETRELQQAFNELSARAALMLNLVGQLSRNGSVNDKLNTILAHSQEALGVNWIGFLELQEERVALSDSVPENINRDWKYRHVSTAKSLGKQLSTIGQGQWLDINNLTELALRHHDERFLRELHKRTSATHVMGYGFLCPRQHRFVLLFTTRHEEGFRPHQQELMRTLAHLMVNAVIDGMDNDALSQAGLSPASPAADALEVVDLDADIAALQAR